MRLNSFNMYHPLRLVQSGRALSPKLATKGLQRGLLTSSNQPVDKMHSATVLITLLGVLFGLSTAAPVKRGHIETLVKWLEINAVDIPETDPSTRKPTRINDVGCYQFVIDFIKDFEKKNTAQNCIDYCHGQDYGFAGLLQGSFCVCYDSTERYDNEAIAESACSSVCTGNSTQKCGGDKALSLYDTDGPYEGCFPFEVDFLKNFAEKNSLSKCLDYCNVEGYDFAGVLNTNYCFCDNSYEKQQNSIKLIDSECSSQCPGNSSQSCGGADNMAYYGIEGSECLGNCAGSGLHQGDIAKSNKQRSANILDILNKLFPQSSYALRASELEKRRRAV